ncbi:MAG: energy transducer TonB [Bacteroidales bacterium]
MAPKKTQKADLENKRSFFFETGLALTLLIILMAFEWETTKTIDVTSVENNFEKSVIELPPVLTEPAKLVPPAPPKRIIPVDKIVVIDNNMEPKGNENIFDEPDYSDTAPSLFIPVNEPEVDEPFISVEVMPKFGNGGIDEFRIDYVLKNTVYPEEAQINGVSGCVYVEFVVEKNGSVSNVKVIKGADALLNGEAIRVVKSSPRWTPGTNNGKLARVKFTIPIYFKLNSK